MINLAASLFLVVISVTSLGAQYQSQTVRIEDPNPVSASANIYESEIRPYCVDRTSGNPNIFPTGQSVENFINLVERLELYIANDSDTSLRQHIGAENVAKLLLRRFRFDGYNAYSYSQSLRDNVISEMASTVLTSTTSTTLPTDYAFPNKFFTQAELCSLYNMLSHNLYDITYTPRVSYSQGFRVRAKRQTYQQNQNRNDRNNRNNQQNYGNQNNQNIPNNPYNQNQNNQNNQNNQYRPNQYRQNIQRADSVSSPYLSTSSSPIKEEGVASFRSTKEEAIQLSRVLMGVIAGLTTSAKTRAKDVLTALKSNPIPLASDSDIDPVTMVTLADLYGVTTRTKTDNKKYYYGLSGEWPDQCCTSYYGISTTQISQADFNASSLSLTVEATRAEIRGGIDGYKIGKALQTMGTTDLNRLRLSSILRSYYQRPQTVGTTTSSFTVSYCDRTSNINIQDIENYANIYRAIVERYKGKQLDTTLINEFKTAFSAAQTIVTTGFNDYCTKPAGTLDETAPCETPADVLYFIDGSSQQKLQDSATVVAQLNGNMLYRLDGGTTSIFFTSQQKTTPNTDIQLPIGTGNDQWPLAVAVFNSSNAGYAQCRINDFNTTLPPAVANTGKLFRYLNATLFDYEWWTPRTNQSWVPSKTAVIIDYDSVAAAPNDGQDRNDYNWFKDQLRSRHRDVLFLSLARNNDLFKDILRDQDNDKASPSDVQNYASTLTKKMCENPATFQYNSCYERASSNVQYTGYISPGYKQNWAMYPEFFHRSFYIKFTFKAEDGNIKVCFDRTFPPKRTDWCLESSTNPTMEFEISNPCKGRSWEWCDPFYFTVWGKDKTSTTQCLDNSCQNLNQIRWSVTHSGVQCNSSHHLLPNISFQLISLTLFAILYLFLSK